MKQLSVSLAYYYPQKKKTLNIDKIFACFFFFNFVQRTSTIIGLPEINMCFSIINTINNILLAVKISVIINSFFSAVINFTKKTTVMLKTKEN